MNAFLLISVDFLRITYSDGFAGCRTRYGRTAENALIASCVFQKTVCFRSAGQSLRKTVRYVLSAGQIG